MSLIIVEGVDGSGKTTFINELAHHASDNARIKHCGPLKRPPLVEYESELFSYRPENGDVILCDRWHVGEMIYGPLYRGASQLSPAMAKHVELFLQSRGAVRIWMDTPFETVEHRIAERGEDFLRPEHLHMVMDFYADYCDANGWRPIKPNYQQNKMPATTLAEAAKRAEEAAELRLYGSYVGPRLPETLILASANRGRLLPALTPFPGTFANMAMSCIAMAAPDRSYGIVDPTSVDVQKLHRLLGKPRVVSIDSHSFFSVRKLAWFTVDANIALPSIDSVVWTDLPAIGRKLKDLIDG